MHCLTKFQCKKKCQRNDAGIYTIDMYEKITVVVVLPEPVLLPGQELLYRLQEQQEFALPELQVLQIINKRVAFSH